MTHDSKCPVCDHHEFISIDEISFGSWEDLKESNIKRKNKKFVISECKRCRHVKITTEYDDTLFHDIYGNDSAGDVYWGAGIEDPLGPYGEMVEFCQPIRGENGKDIKIVDLGCGKGTLLNVLKTRFQCSIDQLVGMDFQNYLTEEYCFEILSLNDVDKIAENRSIKNAGLLFCSHILEHLVDPYQTLAAIYLSCKNGVKLYIEVPDNSSLLDCGSGNVHLINQQHIQYFTLQNLIKMIERSGFEVIKAQRKITGELPRLMVLATKSDDDNSNKTIRSLAEIRARRAGLAARVLKMVKNNKTVAVWGVGADFAKIIEGNAEIASSVKSGLVTLYDQGLAGKYFMGVKILDSAEIKDFDGPVFITPMIRNVREGMLNAAIQNGFSNGQIIDPHE